jgi:hypothetical protein
VYIAIDANIELCEEDGLFDVYGYLKKVRGLRRGLVETLVSSPHMHCKKPPPKKRSMHCKKKSGRTEKIIYVK